MGHPLIEVRDLKKMYGRQIVLNDLSFVISEGQKIALIGRNGAGKSTLLNVLIGKTEADSGEFRVLPRTRIGVVHQNEVLPDSLATQAYLEFLTDKPVWDILKLAARFGLTDHYLSMPPRSLSGGYQMRVKLVAMLLQDPNLLLLDEPVNYLDLQTLLLLEKFLADYKGSFVLIAHDREFLQNTCTETFEIERGRLATFVGGVSEYLSFKREQERFVRRTNKKLMREIKHHQTFVDRFRFKSSLASRAQSKLKHISKLRRKLAGIDVDLATTRIDIPTLPASSGTALDVENLTVGYGEKRIVEDVTFHLVRGNKAVIAGENGRGKSTLLKTLAGKIPAIEGKMKWWHRADIGYFDQMTENTLRANDTVLQYLMRMGPGNAPSERILQMAGNFLFQDDDLDKKCSVLSGGERSRLCLAGMLLQPHNVLILDEPTNHLDVETAEALAEALKRYPGTVIFVSHARTFVNAIADHVLEIRAGRIRQYPGNYEEYVREISDIRSETDEGIEEVKSSRGAPPSENRIRVKEVQKQLRKVEKMLEAFEIEKSEIMKYFFENPTDYAPAKAMRLAEVESEILSLEKEWLKGEEEIELLRHK
jgi:ATP-binding cassette, subfamily F, member 3